MYLFTMAATHAQPALMLLNDSLAHPKPEARAFGILGRKERFKNMWHVFRRDTTAIVGDGYTNALAVLPIMDLPYSNIDMPKRGDGLNRI